MTADSFDTAASSRFAVCEIAYFKAGNNFTNWSLANEYSSSLCTTADYQHPYLYSLHQRLTFRVPRDTTLRTEGAPHHLRFDIAYMRAYFHWMHSAESLDFAVCGTPDTKSHLFFRCLIYEIKTQDLIHAISLVDIGPFNITKAIGAWPGQDITSGTNKPLCIFCVLPNSTLCLELWHAIFSGISLSLLHSFVSFFFLVVFCPFSLQ